MNQGEENRDKSQVAHHMAASSETGRGYLTGPGLYQFPVEYAVVDGVAIYDGCIELGPVEEVEQEAAAIQAAQASEVTTAAAGADESDPDGVQKGVGLPVDSRFLWTNGVVPYTVNSDVPNTARVNDAIEHIEENTAIRFVRRTSTNAARYPNYVEIVSNGNAGWSSSRIGMRGGRQLIRFADGHSWPILVHEFLHALGVYHEQSRSDRDDFVEIKWDNILDGPPPPGEMNALGNFQKQPGSTDYYDYDYGSIMHYRGTSFAKDRSKPTIVPKRPGVTIGQRNGLSYGDRLTIAKMYQRYFTRGYSGVWRSGSGRYALWANASWTSFKDKWQTWSAQGLRLHDITVQRRGGRNRYSGVFLPGSGSYALWANVSWDSFRTKWQTLSAQGLRLVDMHVHRVGTQNRYSGVFLPGSGAYGLWVNASWDSFRAKWQAWSQQGLRLVDIQVVRVNGQNRYSGVFLPGTGAYALWANASWSSFFSKWQTWSAQGLRLVDINVHRVGNATRYSGAFLPGTDGYYLWANVTFESFRAKWQEQAERGLRLIDFEMLVPPVGASDGTDASLMTEAAYAADELEPFGGIVELGVPAGDAPAEQEEAVGDTVLFGDQDLADADSEATPMGDAYFEPDLVQDAPVQDNAVGDAFFPDATSEPVADEEGVGAVILTPSA